MFGLNPQQIKDTAANLRRVADSVQHLDMFRADVESGVLAKHLVTATLAELFRHEFPETKWANGGLIPFATNIDEGAKLFAYQESIRSGRAAIVADNADDIPQASVEGRTNLRGIKTVAIEFNYGTQDIRSSRMQGMMDIAQEKAAAAREGYDLTINDLIRTGDEEIGFRGITNAPGIFVQDAITGTWATATAPQIIADFTAAATSAMDDTDGVEMPDTALFGIANFNRISTLPFDTASGPMTVLNFLKTAFPQITRWDWEHGLSTVGTGGSPAVLIYRNEKSRLRAVFPMALKALAPQPQGLGFRVILEARFGGVIVPKPKSVVRLQGT